MQGAEGGWKVTEKVSNLPSLGVFYNTHIRNNGTARRVSEAIFRMGGKDTGFVRYQRPPGELTGRHDLHLFIDDGRDDIEWMPPSPNACWLIDTHLGFDMRLSWARKFDTVFLAQHSDVDNMKAQGVENIHWLPLACSPYLDPNYQELKQAFPKEALHRLWDCVFVGFLNRGAPRGGGNDRVKILDQIFRAFPNSWLSYNTFFLDAAKRYVRGRVGLNVSIKQDLNMRFFEGLSYGVCHVCNRDMEGWADLGFVEGTDFVGWNTVEEAVDKISWLLKHPEEREEIAEAGMKKVRAHHTYEDRVRTLLEICGF